MFLEQPKAAPERGTIQMPWHDFRATSSHVFIWWTGMVFFGILYIMVPMTAGGAFQYSFASLTEGRLTSAQLRAFWLLVFTPLVLLAVYWARKFHTVNLVLFMAFIGGAEGGRCAAGAVVRPLRRAITAERITMGMAARSRAGK
mgnify:CR=1 FL=1